MKVGDNNVIESKGEFRLTVLTPLRFLLLSVLGAGGDQSPGSRCAHAAADCIAEVILALASTCRSRLGWSWVWLAALGGLCMGTVVLLLEEVLQSHLSCALRPEARGRVRKC